MVRHKKDWQQANGTLFLRRRILEQLLIGYAHLIGFCDEGTNGGGLLLHLDCGKDMIANSMQNLNLAVDEIQELTS